MLTGPLLPKTRGVVEPAAEGLIIFILFWALHTALHLTTRTNTSWPSRSVTGMPYGPPSEIEPYFVG